MKIMRLLPKKWDYLIFFFFRQIKDYSLFQLIKNEWNFLTRNFKDKNTTFQKRGLFSNFLLKKVSKDQIFVEKLLTELERQVEQIQQNKLDEEEELKRNILNKYLVGSSSRRFLNDFMTLRFWEKFSKKNLFNNYH